MEGTLLHFVENHSSVLGGEGVAYSCLLGSYLCGKVPGARARWQRFSSSTTHRWVLGQPWCTVLNKAMERHRLATFVAEANDSEYDCEQNITGTSPHLGVP